MDGAGPGRRTMYLVLLVGLLAGALAFGVHQWAGAARDRVAARSAVVWGKVTSDDRGIYVVAYEHDDRTFEKSFDVNNGPYDKTIRLLVNPEDPTEAYIAREREVFLPAWMRTPYTLAIMGGIFVTPVSFLLAAAMRRKIRAQDRAALPAAIPATAPGVPGEELRSALVAPRFGIEWLGLSWEFGNRSGPPSGEDLRAVAARAGNYGPADPNLALLDQPVLLVQHFRMVDSCLWGIWLPDGTLAGAARRSLGAYGETSTLLFTDAAGEVLARLQAPLRYLRARGAQSLRDGSGTEIGITRERGFLRRDLYLGPSETPVAVYRKHSLNHASIADGAGNVLADIKVHALGGTRLDSVLHVRFISTEEPLRTLVFTNAVMAFKPLQYGNQNGGGG